MNESETRMILSQVSALDNRKLNDAGLAIWYEVFRDYGYEEVKWALYEYARHATEYLMPAHLTSLINQKRLEYRMMNPAMEFASKDAWLEFEDMQALLSEENRRIKATAARSAIEAANDPALDA
jgi:hypothetical protein